MSSPPAAAAAKKKKKIRNLATWRDKIRNDVAWLIRTRGNMDEASARKKSSGKHRIADDGSKLTIAPKKSVHMLTDAGLLLLDELINKAVGIMKMKLRKTLTKADVKAAMSMVPSSDVSLDDKHNWDLVIQEIWKKWESVFAVYATTGDGNTMKEGPKGRLSVLMQKEYELYIRPTLMGHYLRDKLPGKKTRISGYVDLLLSVFLQKVIEIILESTSLVMQKDVKKGTNRLCPRHIAKGMSRLTGFSHLFADTISYTKPVTHFPTVARKVKPKRGRGAS